MAYQIESNPGFTVVRLESDRLDANIAPSLKSEFTLMSNQGVSYIIFDLERARYCDSSGLSSILLANRLCVGQNGKLVICNLQEPVQKIINVSQLQSVISIASSLDEAKSMMFN